MDRSTVKAIETRLLMNLGQAIRLLGECRGDIEWLVREIDDSTEATTYAVIPPVDEDALDAALLAFKDEWLKPHIGSSEGGTRIALAWAVYVYNEQTVMSRADTPRQPEEGS